VEKLSQMTGFGIAGYSDFKGGRKVLGYLKADKMQKLLGWEMENYMVIGNSHDGTTGFFIGTSEIMIRCMNQFSRISQNLKAYHTKNNIVRIDELVGMFKQYQQEQQALYEKMKQYKKIKVDEHIISALTERLFRIESGHEEISTRKMKLTLEFKNSLDREMADLGQNLFGLFQGVTHYTTHVKKTKEDVFGNILGQNAKMNNRAMVFCDALVK
jgi:hypothetical protein